MRLQGIPEDGLKRIGGVYKSAQDRSGDVRFEALAKFLEDAGELIGPEDLEDIVESRYDKRVFEFGGAEYLVLSDREADEAFSDYLDNYINDVVLDEIPEGYRAYFDWEKFKRDVELSDGRGPTLSSYDGEENEVNVGGEWYFIYRVN